MSYSNRGARVKMQLAFSLVLLMSACSAPSVRCDTRLQAINAPTPATHAATASPRGSP